MRRSQRPISQKRSVVAIGVVALLSAAIFALHANSARDSYRAPSPVGTAMLLDGPFSAKFAGELVALKQKYFGSSIDVVSHVNDPDFVEAVANRNAIGVTSGVTLLLALGRGAPVTAFAASFQDTAVGIFSLEKSGLKRPADLVGKRIGFSKNAEAEVIFDAMMAQLSLPRSTITKVWPTDGFDALRAQEVDAFVTRIENQPDPADSSYVKTNVIKPQDYGIHVPGLVYFASNDLVRNKPSLILDALHGIIKGWEFVYSDYDQSVPILVELSAGELRSERLKFELQQQRALVLPIGSRIADCDESRWRTLRDILVFARLEVESVPIAQVVSYRFLQEVYRRSPTLGSQGAWGR